MQFVLHLPGTLGFDTFAFYDTGSNLTAQYLISNGYRPTIDFSYPYGLLPLIFGRTWFALFGITPRACVALIPVIDLLIIWGLVRFAVNLRLNFAGVLLLALGAFLIIPSSFTNLSDGMEPIFIIHALADQAAGNRRRALALATVCVFVKPSMAFFLGFILIVFMVAEALQLHDRPLSAFITDTRAAAVIGSASAAAIALAYGYSSLLGSIFPVRGIGVYHAQGFGFFEGAGRSFWAPPGAPWVYYLANPAGVWIVYTIALIVAGLVVVSRALAQGATRSRIEHTSEIIVSCAFLHLSFILLFFGNQFSWRYYFYVLVLGLCAAARRWQLVVAALALALPLSKVGKAIVLRAAAAESRASAISVGGQSGRIAALPNESGFSFQHWYSTRPSPETANLWAPPDERAEWQTVLATIRGRRAAMLEYVGCAAVMFPEFSSPVTLYLDRGEAGPAEIVRELAQLKSSDVVVMHRWQATLLNERPDIGTVIRQDFRIKHKGSAFVVFIHR